MADNQPKPRRWIARLVAIAIALVVLDWLCACALLWHNYALLTRGLKEARWPLGGKHASVQLIITEDAEPPTVVARADVWPKGTGCQAAVEYEDVAVSVAVGEDTRAWRDETCFVSNAQELPRARDALRDAARQLPPTAPLSLATAALFTHPLITGICRTEDAVCFAVRHQFGTAAVGVDGVLRHLTVHQSGTTSTHEIRVHRDEEPAPSPPANTVQVDGDNLDHSLAAALGILALQSADVPKEPDAAHREGKGWLRIKDGRRVLHVEGTQYEMGYQHGKLLAPNVRRLVNRLVYGVGLEYSLSKGRWFLKEAKRLVERQRPYLDPAYFEEMRGLADGSGVPLAEIQVANIFPEFFHCSGAALFGKATKGGELLHARVLDYMTEVGLQDEAVVMAFAPEGRHRWVNVGYAGFIGSVTGMNEAKVAIGEMGGGGEGQWDGTPMSFLVRGALENCDSLNAALNYMRTRPRTCEYYYVVSDGEERSAAGIAATPDSFLIVKPGEAVPLLPDPVPDAVLLSAGDRYRELVRRVRARHGSIGPNELLEIIRRPVAMESNLHNAVFAPQRLTLWVNNAARDDPACNQPATRYGWEELFGKRHAPSR